MNTRSQLKQFIPPVLLPLFRRLRSLINPPFIEWLCVPEGWSAGRVRKEIKGWNVDEVLETYRQKWPRFKAMTEGTGPLGISHESDLRTNDDINAQNTVLAFAYSLAVAARRLDRISMLDWGGGIGHYYLLAQAALHGVEVEYHCKEVPVLAEHGAQLFPDQHFYTDESCLQRTYQFVLASGSLHFVEDWAGLLQGLAGATRGYCLITRLPTVLNAPSFVFVQRPYAFGYNTEYLGWCLNRSAFIGEADRNGLTLIREFVIAETPVIVGAPEQCQYRGFLFHRQ